MVRAIDIIIPIYGGNLEEFEPSFKKQYNYYKKNLKDFKWNILISINGLDAKKIINLTKNICINWQKKLLLLNRKQEKKHKKTIHGCSWT